MINNNSDKDGDFCAKHYFTKNSIYYLNLIFLFLYIFERY